MKSALEALVCVELRLGPRSAQELANKFGVNPSTISKTLKLVGDDIVRMGHPSHTRYGLRSEIDRLGSSWPLYLIGPSATPELIGQLCYLANSSCWINRTGGAHWDCLFDGEFKSGHFPGLPWFLEDARPQGFLGRAFARRHASELGQDSDPSLWGSPKIIETMLRFGESLPSAFILGLDALKGAMKQGQSKLITSELRSLEYPLLAEEVLSGNVAGSLAGGEQPKFLASFPDGRHVLVKFSPPMTSAVGRRWADLLVAEKFAAHILSQHGYSAPRMDVVDYSNRRFLEVERFDRTPAGGRQPIVSLSALDGAFVDQIGGSWTSAATSLRSMGWLHPADEERMISLWRFGRMIANSDMHYGNISFQLNPRKPVDVAPVYDMLPMFYRPDSEGQMPEFDPAGVSTKDATSLELKMAIQFWSEVSDSKLVSPEFKAVANSHLRLIVENES